jgi:hypothetical protein
LSRGPILSKQALRLSLEDTIGSDDPTQDRRAGSRFDTNFDHTAIRNLVQVGSVGHLHIGGCCGACTRDATVHSDRWGQDRPLDPVQLRAWIAEVFEQYRDRDADASKHWHRKRQQELAEAFRESDDSRRRPPRSMIRKLAVTGVVNYLSRTGQASGGTVPAWFMLDLIVFAMSPVITARRLPSGWKDDLAALTSPRIAALVEQARASRRAGAQRAVEDFAYAVARRDYTLAVVNLFGDLADHDRGGPLLSAMAAAASIERPTYYSGKRMFLWAVGVATASAALEVALHHGQAIADFAADLFEDPEPEPADSSCGVSAGGPGIDLSFADGWGDGDSDSGGDGGGD